MALTEVYIGEDKIDIADAEQSGIAISYSIGDINELGSRDSAKSKTITFPGTPTNKLKFGFAEDINSASNIDQNQKPDARIEIGGTTLIRGFLKMLNAVRDGLSKTVSYTAAILGDNGDWQQKIKYLKLSDLDYSAQNHDYTEANITASETVAAGRDYVYPLIQYGAFTGTVPNVGHVAVEDRYPAMNIKSMLTKVFNNQGYKVVSNFVDSDFFGKLYMPFTKDKLEHDDSWRLARLFRAGLNSNLEWTEKFKNNTYTLVTKNITLDNDSTGVNFDNSNVYSPVSPNYYWTVDKPGMYRVNAGASFSAVLTADEASTKFTTDSFLNFKFEILVNGAVKKSYLFTEYELPETLTSVNFHLCSKALSTDYIKLEAGDIVKFRVNFIGQMSYAVVSGVIVKLVNTSVKLTINANPRTFLSNEVLTDVFEGTPIVLNNTLPEDNQLEFIQGLKDLFNLYFYTDTESRTVYIEPRDDFYTSEFVDWSGKLDVNDKWEISPVGEGLSNKIKYCYKKDSSDKWVTLHYPELGSHTASITNKFAKDETTDKANPLFSPTLTGQSFRSGVPIPLLLSSEKGPRPKTTKFNPRILYYEGVKTLETGVTWRFKDTTRTTYPFMYSYDDSTDNDNSLLFEDTVVSSGLFERYHRNTHRLYNESRIVTAMFNLNDVDISNLDFRKLIYVEHEGNGAFYYLNKINNYKPGGRQTTEVELLKKINTIARKPTKPVTKSYTAPPKTVFTGFQNDSPVAMTVNGNTSTANNTLEGSNGYVIGEGLTSRGDGQVVFGRYNEPDDNARFIVGAGSEAATKTVLKIDENGNIEVGGGANITATINETTTDIYYTDSNGKSHKVII